ncbi:MAG: hypothetical protein ACRCUS_06915 [Anaerovoracaceae bacterium]
MIISAEELKKIKDFEKMNDTELKLAMSAIESTIRSNTHNKFHNRRFRSFAAVKSNLIVCKNNMFRVGDTIELSKSLNEGLYTVLELTETGDIKLDPDLSLIDEEGILVTRVDYPADIVQGAINLLKWDVNSRDKVGIKSESISRHSVSYYDLDKTNSDSGYPVGLMSFIKPYIKART